MAKKKVLPLTQKIIISGSLVERLAFSQPPKGEPRKFTEEEKQERKRLKVLYNAGTEIPDVEKLEPSIRRARSTLRRLIYANAWAWRDRHGQVIPPKFLTLTFTENITDLRTANAFLTKYISKVNYKYRNVIVGQLKYVCVVEFQVRGAVHYHLILFNFPFVDKVYSDLRTLWGGHRINLKTIDRRRGISGMVSYMSKYLTKQATDGRFWGQKRYFVSNGLLPSLQIKNDDIAVELVRQSVQPFQKFENTFEVPYVGDIQYWAYYLGDGKGVDSIWFDPYAKEQIELARKKKL